MATNIWDDKSIWDEDSADWIEQLWSEAEQQAQQSIEEEESSLVEEDDSFRNEIIYGEDEEEDTERQLIRSGYESEKYASLYASSGGFPTSEGFSGIYKTEGARTGQPTNLNSSAIGRGQMIKGTRHAMYKKLGISDVAAAEKEYASNPEFEQQVNDAYRETLDARIPSSVQGKQREYMIAKGWYTGDPFYDDNKVPHPEAGNRLTAGEYARKSIKQYGGGEEIITQYDEYGNPVYYTPSGVLKRDMFNIQPSSYEFERDLPEVGISAKRNANINDVNIASPIKDILGEVGKYETNKIEKEFLSNVPADVFEIGKEIGTFVKNKASGLVDAIDTGLDTTIGYLADNQNNENLRKYRKKMNSGIYNSIRPTTNKQRAYV